MSPANVRMALTEEIERLIALLDALDGDPDLELEEGNDEPDDFLEDGGDTEPSLGWSNPLPESRPPVRWGYDALSGLGADAEL